MPPPAVPVHPLDLWLTRVCVLGVYAGLLLPIAVIPGFLNPYVYSKMVFFQLAVGATFPAYVLLCVRCPDVRPRKSLLTAAIATWLFVIAFACAASEDTTRAFFGSAQRMTGTFSLMHCFA